MFLIRWAAAYQSNRLYPIYVVKWYIDGNFTFRAAMKEPWSQRDRCLLNPFKDYFINHSVETAARKREKPGVFSGVLK